MDTYKSLRNRIKAVYWNSSSESSGPSQNQNRPMILKYYSKTLPDNPSCSKQNSPLRNKMLRVYRAYRNFQSSSSLKQLAKEKHDLEIQISNLQDQLRMLKEENENLRVLAHGNPEDNLFCPHKDTLSTTSKPDDKLAAAMDGLRHIVSAVCSKNL